MLNFMTVLQQLCAKVKIEKVTSVCCSTLTYIKTQSCFSEEKYIFNAFFLMIYEWSALHKLK